MFHLIMWITGVIFVIVEALLLFFLWKYRHREGRQAHYTHGNNRLEVIWTIIPALICVMLALLSRRIWEEIKENMPAGRAPGARSRASSSPGTSATPARTASSTRPTTS